MNPPEISLPPQFQPILDRFIAICQNDERILVAFLSGSYARGAADRFSDLDFGVITTPEAFDGFISEKNAFVEQLGEVLLFEDFDIPGLVWFILRAGVDCELNIGREDALDQLHSGPSRVLLDKKGLLPGGIFNQPEPPPEGQVETLRRLIYGFHHDLSHLITALGRGQLWWAAGQLEILRGMCVSLARLQHNFSAEAAADEPYFKVEKDLAVEKLAPLKSTFCPLDQAAMLQSAHLILQFYRQVAQSLAREHGLDYPEELDRLMLERVNNLPKKY